MYDHDYDDCSNDGYFDAMFHWWFTRKVGTARTIFTRYMVRRGNAQRYVRAYGVRRALRTGE